MKKIATIISLMFISLSPSAFAESQCKGKLAELLRYMYDAGHVTGAELEIRSQLAAGHIKIETKSIVESRVDFLQLLIRKSYIGPAISEDDFSKDCLK
ncbi:MAG: hypothetical protein IPM97_17590 [Bdellovibrionaceae bacterium]|nr:hypothetical protein [Pseudobdellovibrionaceae bacterium]